MGSEMRDILLLWACPMTVLPHHYLIDLAPNERKLQMREIISKGGKK